LLSTYSKLDLDAPRAEFVPEKPATKEAFNFLLPLDYDCPLIPAPAEPTLLAPGLPYDSLVAGFASSFLPNFLSLLYSSSVINLY
jgi:hypothetical protein